MRRLLLLIGALLILCNLALAGIVIAGRITDAPVCLQYRTYDNTSLIYGVIDANTGAALLDRGRNTWTYLYTVDDYSLAAKRHSQDNTLIRNQSYASYDLAIASSELDVSGRRTFTMLQEGMLIPITNSQFADAILYQLLSTSLIISPEQFAFRWLDSNLHGLLTLVNKDGSNHRTVALDTLNGLSSPVAWSADARYILMRTEQATRFKPYAVLDVQTLKPVPLPPELRILDANWQSAVWSPTQPQLAAIRPATSEIVGNMGLITPLQLVLYSPADGTTHIVDLPSHFYAQEIVWSPNGQVGAVVGTYIASDDGRSTAQDYKAYVFFTATGELRASIVQGIWRPQLEGRVATRLGAWRSDGSAWLYLRENAAAPTSFYELVAVNNQTLVEEVLENRIAPEWWAEVFNDSAAAEIRFGVTPPSTRQDIVLITRGADNRLNFDLIDTRTMKRTSLVKNADRITAPRRQTSIGESAFRLTVHTPDMLPILIYDALVEKDGDSLFVWSTLDGTNRHEMLLDADSFDINSGWAFQQPTLLYHLKRGDQSTIGKIDVRTGAQIDLLKALTFMDDNFNVMPLGDGERAVFTTTNILTGPFDVYLSALDGSFSKLLATLIQPDPVWQKDGSQLAYMKVDNGRFKVSIVDKDGTLLRELNTGIKLTQKFQGLYLVDWSKCPA